MNWKVAPLPSTELTEILPPKLWIIFLTVERPIPFPLFPFLSFSAAVENKLNTYNALGATDEFGMIGLTYLRNYRGDWIVPIIPMNSINVLNAKIGAEILIRKNNDWILSCILGLQFASSGKTLSSMEASRNLSEMDGKGNNKLQTYSTNGLW